MLKKTLIAGAVLAASTGLAFANGGTIPQPHHTGAFYLGAGISGDFGHFDGSTTTHNAANVVTRKSESEAGSAGVGGDLFGGYGMTFQNQYYVGLELFGSISSLDVDANKLTLNGKVTSQDEIKLKYSYGVSLIPGYKLNDTTMLYGRIGYIRSKFKLRGFERFTNVDTGKSVSKNLNGIQLGIGVDTAVTNNVSIRAEYDYNHYFNDVSHTIVFAGGGHVKSEMDARINQVKVGIVYHFTDMGGMFS